MKNINTVLKKIVDFFERISSMKYMFLLDEQKWSFFDVIYYKVKFRNFLLITTLVNLLIFL